MEEFRSLGQVHETVSVQENSGKHIKGAVLLGPCTESASYQNERHNWEHGFIFDDSSSNIKNSEDRAI